MNNHQLTDYIKEQYAAGFTKGAIKTALLSQGWSEQAIDEGFSKIENLATPLENTQNIFWTKNIPRANNFFMILSLPFVFGLDVWAIIEEKNDSIVRDFWYLMLIVLAAFAIFYYLENFVFRKKFADTASIFDRKIERVIFIRNTIFFLNFIPIIQLLGLAALVFVGWLVLIFYIVLIIKRYRQINT